MGSRTKIVCPDLSAMPFKYARRVSKHRVHVAAVGAALVTRTAEVAGIAVSKLPLQAGSKRNGITEKARSFMVHSLGSIVRRNWDSTIHPPPEGQSSTDIAIAASGSKPLDHFVWASWYAENRLALLKSAPRRLARSATCCSISARVYLDMSYLNYTPTPSGSAIIACRK